MNPLRLTLSLVAGAALSGTLVQAQEPPTLPETEADAVRMLASDDYRERDQAMFFVLHKAKSGEPIGAELRAAMLRAVEEPGWEEGRPNINSQANADGWGETWSFYREAVARMRDPAAVPFMLAEGIGAYDLAAIGRPALLPMIEALEDPEADPENTVSVSVSALTLLVHDGLPTEDERARIVQATVSRLERGGLPLSTLTDAFGLAVTLGTAELVAIVERVAKVREAAAAMNIYPELVDDVQESAREAIERGFVPRVIRWRHRHDPASPQVGGRFCAGASPPLDVLAAKPTKAAASSSGRPPVFPLTDAPGRVRGARRTDFCRPLLPFSGRQSPPRPTNTEARRAANPRFSVATSARHALLSVPVQNRCSDPQRRGDSI